MTGIVTTALTGFFVWSSVAGPLAGGGVLQTSDAPEAVEVTTPTKTLTVSMTGYNAVPEQTDSDPFTTASGAFSDPDIVAARSVDLAGELPFGTVIEITEAASSVGCGFSLTEDFVGYRVIADSMHPRKRNQIDLLFGADDWVRVGTRVLNPAVALGFCKDVKINIVGRVNIANIPATQAELKAAIGKSVFTVNR